MKDTVNPSAPQSFLQSIQIAIEEDLGKGDLTASLIDKDVITDAYVITRETTVISGRDWFNAVFMAIDPDVFIHWHVMDSEKVDANTRLCEIRGSARSILTAERTALNFLQTLSGTATKVRHYVDEIKDTGATLLDTRKTIPGLRQAQKYAVTCGGGKNHRKGLYDGILIKENHIAAAGSIKAAMIAAKKLQAGVPIEVEVETLQQLEEALGAGADIVLLDNMDTAMLTQAVAINKGRARLEASGGITLENIRVVAQTGVDYISIGALTKDVKAIDLSMRFSPINE